MAVSVQSIKDIASATGIAQIVDTLKDHGILPSKRLTQMKAASRPGDKIVLFVAALVILGVIAFTAYNGSKFIWPSYGPVVSVILSVAAVVGLAFCFFDVVKGRAKYIILIADLILTIINATTFVSGALGKDEALAMQIAYNKEEQLAAQDSLKAILAYVYTEKDLHTIADTVATSEQRSSEGPVYITANTIRSLTTGSVLDSFDAQIHLPAMPPAAKIKSLDDIKQIGQNAHKYIVDQMTQPMITARDLKQKANDCNSAINRINIADITTTHQKYNLEQLKSKIDGLINRPDFKYEYKAKVVTSMKLKPKWVLLSLVLDFFAILFWVLLINRMIKEEKVVDMQAAIDEALQVMLKQLAGDWNIKVAGLLTPISTFVVDHKVITILEWLNDHEGVRKNMQVRNVTLEQFIEIYEKYPVELLESIDDERSYFHLDELKDLPDMGDNNLDIIETLNVNEWLLLNHLVDKPEEVLNYAKNILEIWKTATDGQLAITDANKDFFSMLSNMQFRTAIKQSNLSLVKMTDLYIAYGDTVLYNTAGNNPRFTLSYLSAFPTVIPVQVLNSITSTDMAILTQYNVNLLKFAGLYPQIKEGLLNTITSLENRIEDAAARKAYIIKMLKDVTVFTVDAIKVWNILIDKLRLVDALIALTTDILLNLNENEAMDYAGMINQFGLINDLAKQLMAAWSKNYTEILGKWKTTNIYDITLQRIFYKAATIGEKGITTLFAAYQRAEQLLNSKIEEDKKPVAPVVADPVPIIPVVIAPISDFIPVVGGDAPVTAPVEAPVSAPVEEAKLPERKIEVTGNLVAIENAASAAALIGLLNTVFSVK